MKGLILAFVFCLTSLASLAADTTIVKLMQKVIELNVPTYYHNYYYVLDKAENPKMEEFHWIDLQWEKQEFRTKLPWDEFTNAIKADTSTFKWSAYNFPKAKCIDKDHLPRHNPHVRIIRIMPANTPKKVIDSLEAKDQIVVVVKKGATKKQIALQEKKMLARYEAKWPEESYSVFIFSKPIFSSDRQYAIISVELNGGGCHYAFKNINGRWELIASFLCKII